MLDGLFYELSPSALGLTWNMQTMNKYMIAPVALLILALACEPAQAFWPFGPDNYDECVEEYQGDAESDLAIQMIYAACNNKFKAKINIDNADCWLDHVVSARSDVAIQLMVTACTEIHNENRNKPWSKCILKKMDGAKSDLAAQLIAAKCE